MNRHMFLVVAIAVALTPWPSMARAALPAKAEEGVMLHCHQWPFNTIEANLDRIAAAGFNAIQVSPIQRIRDPRPDEKTPEPTGPWYLFYQPVSFKTVGNDKIGTEADFRRLCDKAEQKGIRIIVDVVLNHVASTGQSVENELQLDPELRDPDLYHNHDSICNWQDRWEITQRDLLGMPDLNTQKQAVQDMHVSFLNTCIDLGADGFRFDAAKHIETSGGEDEDKQWKGDYWENVLGRLRNPQDLYCFGEVLQDTGANVDHYQNYYDITCHNFGGALRSAIRDRNVTTLQGHITHLSGIPRGRGLAYVENHDDYEHGHSRSLSHWERKMANVYLITRAGLVPRLLDRPEDDIWEDPDIVAANHFHNALVGEEEFLRFPTRYVALVERGTRAVAVINLGDPTDLDVATGLDDGTYPNRAPTPCTLQAQNGRLKGHLPGGVAFLAYEDAGNPETTIRATYDTGPGHHLYVRGNRPPLSWSKGIKMQWTQGNVWLWQTPAFPANAPIEFKVLINDATWEIVDGQAAKNHKTTAGATADVTPVFP